MRLTVLALELVSWWPIVLLWSWTSTLRSGLDTNTVGSPAATVSRRSKRTRLLTALSILLHPSLILIDNGHFQYNSFPLALTLLTTHLFQTDHDALGAIAFCASLLFKQMSLYWAPAIFAYLLGKCIYLPRQLGLRLFLSLALVTTCTFAAAFYPFFVPFPTALLDVLQRLFPVGRGIFEDKVANFWCASHVLVKWKIWFAKETMAKVSGQTRSCRACAHQV